MFTKQFTRRTLFTHVNKLICICFSELHADALKTSSLTRLVSLISLSLYCFVLDFNCIQKVSNDQLNVFPVILTTGNAHESDIRNFW